MNKPKKFKPHGTRVPSGARTRSLRQRVGSRAFKSFPGTRKGPKLEPMFSGIKPNTCDSPPMNLGIHSTFNDIEECFMSSALKRLMGGKPPLATYYK